MPRVLALVGLLFAQPVWANFIPKKIAASLMHTCALSEDGRVKCWGYNGDGRSGSGDRISHGLHPETMGKNLPIVDLGTDVKASDICVGNDHSCIATNDGKVKCWGRNTDFGALGQGVAVDSNVKMGDALPFTNLGKDFYADSVACSNWSSCALSKDGRVKCWGQNSSGNWGIGSIANRGSKPEDMGDALTTLPVTKPVLSLSKADSTMCAVTADGARCWGDNSYGQLGQGTTVRVLGDTLASAGDKIPTILLEPSNVAISIIKISSANMFSCALYKINGQPATHVKCWGWNLFGQLGLGDLKDRGRMPMGGNLPYVTLDIDELIDIQVHQGSTCVLSRTGRVKCWGNNSGGQLGLGDTESRGTTPGNSGKNVPDVDLGLPAKALSSGESSNSSCAILINNAVKCWGRGDFGNLGYEDDKNVGDEDGSMGDNLRFVKID